MSEFVHLRLHTEFSLVDGLVRIKPLVGRVAELGMPAVAVTDFTNLFGLIKFYKAAQGAGIKPIVGSDLFVVDSLDERHPTAITLLVQNQIGYRNLTKLISLGYQKGQRAGVPYVLREWVEQYAEGLIALSGGRQGEVGLYLLSGKADQAQDALQRWCQYFPDRYYIELQRTGRPDEEEYLHAAVALAAQTNCPVVATNDVRFITEEEFDAHEARVCIHDGRTLDDPQREKRYSEQQYLRSAEEMAELFADIPEALQNSVEIARRCSLELLLDKYFLPDYPIPEGMTIDQFFAEVSHQGLEKRLAILLDKSDPDYTSKRQVYLDRLAFELKIICQMGFPGYFLIVMDFIKWAKNNGVPVGPGRGSGAGSLVAYALDITDLDPLEYDLLFERFLNPERVSMPDFDIDFCMEGRDRVIAYVADTYGRDAVSQIVTFGTMAAKAVVRDVARVQGKSYGLADKLSKMIPFEVGMTLAKAFEQEDILRDFLANDEEAKEIWDMALQLEGVSRNCGKHAGGVVIAPTCITDFSPIYCDETGGGVVTQFDKGDVESAGLVKFDFLGLRTLTIIDWAVDMVNVRRRREGLDDVDISRIPLDDKPTYELMQRAETTAVFQLESRGMKELIRKLGPDRFEDIVALVALFRPGPLGSGMVDDFIDRKKGRQEVSYPHPQYQHECLQSALEPTYGIILYQEQVMQIAQEMAGYTLGGADLLRRAMGKKKPEEMDKQRTIFLEGATAKGHDKTLANNIFDLMEKFAGYGFNKSHSAAYALVAYQTGWLKAHYPAEFMAATISSDMDKTDKVVTFIEECRELKLTLLPPDVNLGQYRFTVDEQGRVIYGLGAIKGLGEGPVANIIAARKDGPFKDLFDFCTRIDSRKVNKRALEAMIKAGALDSIGPEGDVDKARAVLLAALDEAVKLAEQHHRNADAGMGDLFGDTLAQGAPEINYDSYRNARSLRIKDRLEGERETLGLYLTGHPIDEYEQEVRQFVPRRLNDLQPSRFENQTIAGMVVAMRLMKTKNGDSFAFVTLDDKSARIEVTMFSKVFAECREKVTQNALLVVTGKVGEDDYNGGLKQQAETVMTMDEARMARLRAIRVKVDEARQQQDWVLRLKQQLQPYQSNSDEAGTAVLLYIKLASLETEGVVRLGDAWRVMPDDALIHRLRDQFGNSSVELKY